MGNFVLSFERNRFPVLLDLKVLNSGPMVGRQATTRLVCTVTRFHIDASVVLSLLPVS